MSLDKVQINEAIALTAALSVRPSVCHFVRHG